MNARMGQTRLSDRELVRSEALGPGEVGEFELAGSECDAGVELSAEQAADEAVSG